MFPQQKNKTIGQEYKEEYKRKRQSKHISKDPEVRKKFGYFNVTELLKYEDKQHFKSLYKYDAEILDQYMLPEEKREKEKKEQEQKEREKKQKSQNQVEMKEQELNQIQEDEKNAFLEDEDDNTKRLREAFNNIFDTSKKRDDENEEQEYYEKKGSKTWNEIQKMKTGEDAVRFFAMYGEQTPIKFIFCKKKQHEQSYIFTPYDLEIILMKKIKMLEEYFVITPYGITHIYKPSFGEENINKKDSALKIIESSSSSGQLAKNIKSVGEFFTLSDWMYQSRLFNILKKVNYFKNFLPFKIFTIWRNYQRFKKYIKIRSNLANRLFIAKPAFINDLITNNGQVCQLEKVFLHQVYAKTWSTKSEFEDHQRKVHETAKDIFKRTINNEIIETIKVLYTTISRRLKKNRDINEIENNKTLQELKNKSMYNLKLEKEQRRRLIKRASQDKESFDGYINMLDLMVVEMLYQLCKKDLRDIQKELTRERIDSNYTGIFELNLSFENGIVVLNPSENELVSHKFKTLFDGIVDCLCDVPRIKFIFDRKEIDSKSEDDNARKEMNLITSNSNTNEDQIKKNLKRILEQSSFYSIYTSSINIKVSQDFKRALEITRKRMEEFQDLQKKKEEWLVEDYIKLSPSIDEFQREMDSIQVSLIKVDQHIPSSFTQKDSIMNVDSKSVKEHFKIFLEKAKDALEKYLIQCFRENMKEIYELVKKGDDAIKIKKRTNIKDVCETKEAINNYKADLELLNQSCERMKILHMLIKSKYKLESISNSEMKEASDLFNKYEIYTEKINDTLMDINKLKEDLLPELNENVEKTKKRINEYIEDLKYRKEIFFDVNAPKSNIEYELSQMENNINEVSKTLENANKYQKILDSNLDEDPDTELITLKDMFGARNKLWKRLNKLKDEKNQWHICSLSNMKNMNIEEKIAQYELDSNELSSKLNTEKQEEDEVCQHFRNEVHAIKNLSPIIIALSQASLQDRHWNDIFELINIPFVPGKTLDERTLIDLINNDIQKYGSKIDKIAAASYAQDIISKNMDKIDEEWAKCNFVVKSHNNSRDKYIIQTVEEPFALMEEHGQLVQSALNSIYVNDIRDRVQQWDDDLNLVGRVIEEWLMVQKQWIYLENIFSAEDIKRQIPDAHKNFSKVNKGFIELMQKTNDKPNVVERCKQPGLLDMLIRFNKELDLIQKNLENYLQTKRVSFPRFYFLSNDELLKILSQTRNPRAVQDYLIKCFDGIKTIHFASEASNEIISMVSPENEVINLNQQLYAHENIHVWLCDLERIMFSTCYDEVKKCLEGYPDFGAPRKAWILESGYACQAVITVDQILWAVEVENHLKDIETNSSSMSNYLLVMQDKLQELAELVMIKPTGNLREKAKMILGKSLLEKLVIIDVHSRDVVQNLIKENVISSNDFEWQKVLKFYWEQETTEGETKMEVVIRQTNSKFIFGYEYLGNPERMVITQLTDKCYITLTSALHLNFGGAPAGPAGTGKTETTKDLGKALAVKVNVFNCSDQLDLKMMSRMFSGLSECGAWACFDEFNRIDLEVLSVIAQQIETIQSALKEKLWEFVFEGNKIRLKPRFGVFITMNPGYAGRAELPDNLKSLCRPVAMMIPDYALVAEVILLSKGFKKASNLSIKMYQLFMLSSEQLTKQKHYDFGLRGIKSILTRAGYLKEKFYDLEEEKILIRAMKDSNLPKFLDYDIVLFLDIIKDLFPTVEIGKDENKILIHQIKETLKIFNLQFEIKDFNSKDAVELRVIEKVVQLLDTLMTRCGNMIVGLTGVGKSTIYNVLSRTLSDLGKLSYQEDSNIPQDPWYCSILTSVLNPKSVTKSELYMSKDEVTQTWEDGIVAKIMREAEEEEKEEQALAQKEGAEQKKPKRKWVVFDGPVDALWIEDMNTVLDDSRKLCLPDGSNIRIPQMMNLIFEVNDLQVASPATVSRCGMVYIEQHHIGYKPLIETWYLNYKEKLDQQFQNDGSKKNSQQLVDRYMKAIYEIYLALKESVPKIITYIRKTPCSEKIPTADVNLVQSCLNLISSFVNTDLIPLVNEDVEKLSKLYMVFSFFWSFGANIEEADRKNISVFLKRELKKHINDISSDLYDIYDVRVDPKNFTFAKWSDLTKMNPFEYNKNTSYFNILVPTDDTNKYKYLMDVFSKNSINSLFIGETGVGKSVIIMDFLKNLSTGHFLYKSSNFSAKTTTKNIYDLLKTSIYIHGNFQPPSGKKFIYFVDDINMPQYDTYFSQQPIEFLRQLIDNKIFYDEKKHQKKIKDCIFMACCAPPSGGRKKVTPRLFRHFSTIWIPELKEDSMKTIFKEIVKGYLDTSLHTPNKSASSLTSELDDIMDCAIQIYGKIRLERLPTPSKSHYTYNLRDLSKVVQGMLQFPVEKLNDKQTFVYLFVHETCRQFRDRLIQEDIAWFDNIIYKLYTEKLLMERNSLSIDRLIFTNVITRTEYKMVDNHQLLFTKINDALERNNLNKSNYMNLVFFTDAINHFCRIARIISQQRGNALLVGMGGSGRQSLTKLVGSMLSFQICALNIVKGYGIEAFQKDLAKILVRVGTEENKPYLFLFSDTQIIKEAFLEDINNILNNGEVPNLLKDDEINQIFSALKDQAKDMGYPESKDSVYQFFVSKVRDNLRIVLSFSPIGSNFRNRCKQFPSIINCCTIDWFNTWPEDALSSVANRFLSQVDSITKQDQSEDLIKKLQVILVNIHKKALILADKLKNELSRFYYITPTSYIEFLKLFINIYEEKLQEIPMIIQNYKLGITKLDEANDIVKDLKENLIRLQPQQIEKKEEVEKMIIELKEKQTQVEEEKTKLKGDKDIVQAKRDDIAEKKQECDNQLALALPALEQAKQALSGLKDEDIRNMGAYKTPHVNLVNLGKSICIIFDAKGAEYSDFRTIVSDPKTFIKNCQNEEYMVAKLNNPRKLKNVIDNYKAIEHIDYSKVSYTAVGIKDWIGSILVYVQKYKEVKPKMDAVEIMKKQLIEVEANLEEKSKSLYQKEDELKQLQRAYKEENNNLRGLERNIENINIKQKRAIRLVDGMRNEGKKWKENIKLLEKEEKNLMANVIMSASVLGYSGPFPVEYRKEFLGQINKYVIDQDIYYDDSEAAFDLINMLSNPLEVRDWSYAGLPSDNLSIENAILTVRSQRWPLIIDPQMQANKWIKNYYRKENLRFYKLTYKDLFNRLKDCITSGYPVLIENIEETVDTALEPILQKNIYKDHRNIMFMSMGAEKPLQYNPNFKLFMTSKIANPHYLPELSIKVTLINFTVTQKGLEDQLLVDVVKHERPDLESQRDTLILNINENKKLIKELETTILNMVKDAGEDILDTDHLVNKLDQSKVQSTKINKDLEEAETTAIQINRERKAYKPIAIRGSIIYFVIASLANINKMYNYSLEFFNKLFNQRLERSESNKDVQTRVEILISDITISFYQKICRGLFVRDQMLYAFLILMNVLLQAGEDTNSIEWSYFLRGGEIVDKPDDIQADYLSADALKRLVSLTGAAKVFQLVLDTLIPEKETWIKFLNCENPFSFVLPEKIENSISDFQRLILIKTLQDEKLMLSIRLFIEKKFKDKRFVQAPPFNVLGAYEDSVKSTPLIFILSAGANPVIFLKQLAKEKNIRLLQLSLGQGQGKIAKQFIEQARESGDWVCLENCHLYLSWMPELEKIQEEMVESEVNPNYRLWLTSMPDDEFPVSILQSGVKITNEPPKGIKANLVGIFQNIKDSDFANVQKVEKFKTLLFSLAFFHAVILERRKYGPLGWNIQYEWMNSDFECSKLHLRQYLEEYEDTPFKILRYLISTINYGGRVTDDKDGKLISAILNKYFDDLIFDKYYTFSDSGEYYVPKYDTISDAFDYFEKLPIDDSPDVFGLHQNANIILQKKYVSEFMTPLIAIQPRTSASSVRKPDDIVLDIKKSIDEKLSSVTLLDKSKANEDSINDILTGKRSSLGNFLIQETDKYNNLIQVIKSTLGKLELAVKGLEVMDSDLESVYYSFLDDKVPRLWEDVSYLSLKPLASWVVDFIERYHFIRAWLIDGGIKSYWMSAFFFPQGIYSNLGFNTAVLQTYSRKTNLAIDTLTFNTVVLDRYRDQIDDVPKNGLYIHGLFLEGSAWDLKGIKIREPNLGELHNEMPCIWLNPITILEKRTIGFYECPLYKTSTRKGILETTGHSNNFVMYMHLKTDIDANHWIRRGTALLTQLDN